MMFCINTRSKKNYKLNIYSQTFFSKFIGLSLSIKILSIVSLNAWWIIRGIIFANSLEDNSKQGFVLHSISQTWNLLSIIKSYPKISKQCCLLFGLIFFLLIIMNNWLILLFLP